ncbi:hypothetical protein HY441_00140 [Candidatus Microgenomates bacterium]|nr:hypothetical protein [Candidatus Microgenomates bacterium]
MEAQEILIILLSITLIVFLIVAIILTVYLIKVVRNIRHVTAKAETVVDNVASASRLIRPAAISAAVARAVRKVMGKTTKGRKQE